jgi:hypothetical protein
MPILLSDRPYRSKDLDFVKPAPILESSFTPFSQSAETKRSYLHISYYLNLLLLRLYCLFQPFFLDHADIILCYFPYGLNCLFDKHSLLVYNLESPLSSSIYFLRLSTSDHTRFPFLST